METIPFRIDFLRSKLINRVSNTFYGTKSLESLEGDALSRKENKEEGALSLITFPTIDWVNDIKVVYANDEELDNLIKHCLDDKLNSAYTIRNGLLLYKNKLYNPHDEGLKNRLLELAYNNP